MQAQNNGRLIGTTYLEKKASVQKAATKEGARSTAYFNAKELQN